MPPYNIYQSGRKWGKMVRCPTSGEGILMTGEYQHSLDSKGRLFMPAKLREELGAVFYITISMDRCLCAYSSESWDALSAEASCRSRRRAP